MTSHSGDDLVDELREPIKALPRHFGTEIEYDPQARRLLIGPAVTLARRTIIALLRWWVHAVVQRQDHINRLIVRALEQLDQGSPRGLEGRVWYLEERLREHDSASALAELETRALVQAVAQPVPLGRAARRAIIDALGGSRVVVVIGPAPVAMRDEVQALGARILVVDPDAVTIRDAIEAGIEARELAPDVYLQEVADGSLGAVFSMTLLTQLPLGRVSILLRRLVRALAPGAPLVLAIPDASDPVGLLAIYEDPGSVRPVPSSLLERILRNAGFAEVSIQRAGLSNGEEMGIPLLIAVATRPQ